MRCTLTYVTLLICALPFINAAWTSQSFDPYNDAGVTAMQWWTVPPSVYRIRITAVGAAGGLQDTVRTSQNYRGKGIAVSAVFFVQPGDVFNFFIGTMGQDSYRPSGWASWQDNQVGGAGGGGGTFVFQGTGSSANLYLAAGGGGGSSNDIYGEPDDWAMGMPGNAGQDGTAQGVDRIGGSMGLSVAEGGKGWNQIKASSDASGVPKSNTHAGNGGYGGGGAGINNNGNNPCGGGGGGGYSGGASGIMSAAGGGGGGSFVREDGASRTFQLSTGYSQGSVTFEIATTCGENSDFDAVNITCLCRSGYAGNGCVGTASAPGGCPPYYTSVNTTQPFPKIMTNATNPALKPKVEKDNLYLYLAGPYVQDRRYVKVNFKGASDLGSCNFAGKSSYWTKGFGGLADCQDTLALVLPWKKAQSDCKFVKSTIGDLDMYTANLELVFTEPMGEHFGINLVRTSYHNYDVSVYFPNKLEVTLNNTQVKAEVQLDVVLTSQKYNPVAKTLTLEFTTVTPWSGRLAGAMTIIPPADIALVGAIEQNADSAACTLQSGTSCAQKFPMTFQISGGAKNGTCNFDGAYALNATIFACRQGDCTHKSVGITFSLSTGSVCASVEVRPKITGSMKAFTSTDFSADDSKKFKLGDRVYFKAYTDTVMEAGESQNYINMTFQNIRYYSSLGDAVLLDNYQPTDAGRLAYLNIWNKDKYFSIYFSGGQFPIPFDSSVTIDFAATATITWAGGSKKRSVEMFWQVADMDVSEAANMNLGVQVQLLGKGVQTTNVEVGNKAAVAPAVNVMNGFSLVNVIGIAVGGVVVGVVLVMGVVFAIYKKMQNQFVQVPTSEPIHA